jgi:hypothetical protein
LAKFAPPRLSAPAPSSSSQSRPIGNLLEHDERDVAAVQIDGAEPVNPLARDGSSDRRQATLIASLALALPWDPDKTLPAHRATRSRS